MGEATPVSETVVIDYIEMWNSYDYSKIPHLVLPSFILREPTVPADKFGGPAGEVHGHNGLEKYMTASKTALPDLELSVIDMVAREGIVMVELIFSGTHTGPLYGLPPTNRSVSVKEMKKYVVSDNKIQTEDSYYNVREVTEQLGLTFPQIITQLPKLAWRKVQHR